MTGPQAVAALRDWFKRTYDYDLTDAQINEIIRAVGYSGGDVNDEMAARVQAYAAQRAQQSGLRPVGGRPTPMPGIGGVNTGMTGEQAIAELRRWGRSFGYEMTDQDIADIARGIGYTGGPVSASMLDQAKQWAAREAERRGFRPPSQSTERIYQDSNEVANLLKVWARERFNGYNLTDAQIQRIAQAVGYTGGPIPESLITQAKQWAEQNAQELLGITGTTPSPTPSPTPTPTPTPGPGGGGGGGGIGGSGGGTGGGPGGGGGTGGGPGGGGGTGGGPGGGPGGGGGTGGGSGGGGGTTPGPNPGRGGWSDGNVIFDPSDLAELQAWAIQTFGREATQQELNGIASALGYTGGRLTPQQLTDWKHFAIIEAKRQGWTPVGPNPLVLPGFVEPELTGLPEAVTFEEYVAPQAPTYETFQAPEAFQYGEFVAPTKESILADPGYQARLSEGQKALETSAAARGLLRTGATLKGLSRYGQELAAQEYGQAYERQRMGYEMNRGQAEKEWQSAYQKAMDEFQAKRSAQESQYESAYKSAYDMWKGAQETKQLTYQTAYNQAKDKYLAATQKARSEYEADLTRKRDEYQAAYDKWRFIMDDAYRKAQLAAGRANF